MKRIWLLIAPLFLSVQSLAAAPSEPDSRSVSALATLLTWSPLLLFILFFAWYMRKTGFSRIKEHRERHLLHMERVEQRLATIEQALEARNRES